jgi:hypothetical protein
LASDALLTTARPLLENALQGFEISCLGAPFSWLGKLRIAWSEILFGLKKWIGGIPLEHPPYSPDLAPMQFLGFFEPWKGRSEARNFEVINGLQHVFEK